MADNCHSMRYGILYSRLPTAWQLILVGLVTGLFGPELGVGESLLPTVPWELRMSPSPVTED